MKTLWTAFELLIGSPIYLLGLLCRFFVVHFLFGYEYLGDKYADWIQKE